MIFKDMKSSKLPPGPFAYIPVSEEKQTAYVVYCLNTDVTVCRFVYFDSMHLAEMDACVMANALNRRQHCKEVGEFADDSRRISAYREFRSYFPGTFQVRDANCGQLSCHQVERIEIACDESNNLFCVVQAEQLECSSEELSSCLCESLNDFVKFVDSKLDAPFKPRQLSLT